MHIQYYCAADSEMTAVAAGHGWRGNPVHAVSPVKLVLLPKHPTVCPRILLHIAVP